MSAPRKFDAETRISPICGPRAGSPTFRSSPMCAPDAFWDGRRR